MGRIFGLGFLVVFAVAALWVYNLGLGTFIEDPTSGSPRTRVVDESVIATRADTIQAAGRDMGIVAPKQVLFGDLHVHSTFSFDAFQLSLPMVGGDGAHPVSDACDYARHCAALDFWSISDHAVALGPRRWAETVETIRECNAISDPNNPDTVAYLGWEWTQVGWTPEHHYGHKNIVLRDLEDENITPRPISAGLPEGTPPIEDVAPSPFLTGAFALSEWSTGGPELARYLQETGAIRECPRDVPSHDLPTDCRESAPTSKALFDKLNEWDNVASMVIPHGTTWGFYTPLGSSWDKQIAPGFHDPDRQGIIEIMSGHGNSEEFRPFREIIFNPDGTKTCPGPNNDYTPSCWRAGEIIADRCLADGEDSDECAQRAETARQNFVDAQRNGGSATVPGSTVAEWQDAGQCLDCFQPSFNYRPRSSVQYIMALNRPENDPGEDRFRMGFIASSDNHSARPGTGYKEIARSEFTEARFRNFVDTPFGSPMNPDPEPHSIPMTNEFTTAVFATFETERGASFFLNGGLAAVHSEGRTREQIWDAMQRKEVYGTSGPRILLWFDLLNGNGATGRPVPMGSQATLADAPIFQVKAVGSFEQNPGCPSDASEAMTPEQLARVCQGECYHPSDERRPITRIEVIRIRPQLDANEDIATLIDDPWKTFECSGDPAGCQIAFTDTEFATSGRDALYYVRAIEAPSDAVGANPLGCTYDENGTCVKVDYCSGRDADDDCLAPTEERAWSSPIFVDYAGS